MRLSLYTVIFIFSLSGLFAQNPKELDSILDQKIKYSDIIIGLQQHISESILENALKDEVNGSRRIKILNALCWKCFNSVPQKALEYAKAQIPLAEKMKDKEALAAGYTNMGFLYSSLGDYEKSITFLLKALKIEEETKDTADIAVCMNGIGSLYFSMANYPKALEYMFKTLKMDSLLGNKNNLSTHYGNIGICYVNLNQYDKALKYLLRCESLCKEFGQNQSSANLLNTGIVYQKKGEIGKALEYLQNAIKEAEREKDVSSIASVNIALGDLYIQMKEYDKAIKFAEQALSISKENKIIEYEIQALKTLAYANSSLKKYQKAFEYHEQFSDLKDTLLTEQNGRVIAEMNTKYDTDKKEKQIEIQNLTLTQQDLELNKRKIIIYSTAGGIVLLVLLSFFIFRGYQQKKLANIELMEKNGIIEEKSRIVEEQHKDIIDSINYAKRIQQAVLSEEEHISEHLPPHFILFKPKDIVSGDFYWALEKNDYLYVAAADCTGHGVPGAFLTMLGISYLNEINSKEEIFTPAEILNQLRDKIVKELSRHGTTKDGMDISLMRMSLKTREIMWAGAFNPLWYTENGILKEIKANKQPIGYAEDLKPFTNHILLNLKNNDSLYLFTDGLADQFGGPKGKKYKYKQMEDLLMNNRLKPFEEQKEILRKSFDNWKGSLEQVDDVTVIAIQIS
jgi:serine phosphatase RsbU (regulator of sigma subunit)